MPTFCFAFECQFSQEKCFWAKKIAFDFDFLNKKIAQASGLTLRTLDYFEKKIKKKLKIYLKAKIGRNASFNQLQLKLIKRDYTTEFKRNKNHVYFLY